MVDIDVEPLSNLNPSREDKTVHGVFEGGGVRGIALAGAASAALERRFVFDELAGTSAGALVASLVASGYSPDELASAVCSIGWGGLLDRVPGQRIPLIGSHLALVFSRGLYHGKLLEQTWARLLARKGVHTFGDLPPGKLRVVATDITHQVGVVLPDDLADYGIEGTSFPVARALRMSAAVPFMFKPVPLRDRETGERVLFSDGAMASNFPIRVVSDDRPIMGFSLVEAQHEHPHLSVRGPASLARSVMMSGIRARYDLPQPDYGIAVVVEVPVSRELDFGLEPDEARQLFESGRQAAANQLDALFSGSPRARADG